MSSNYSKVKNFRKSVKHVAIQSMGGKCQICGYNRCTAALELHHINPDEKEISFNQIHSWDVLYRELAKAILVCANCHREIHYNDLEIPENYVVFVSNVADSLRNENSHKAQRIPVDSKERMRIIESSDIDFSKRGWGAKLARLLDINPANANLWVKRNMKEFYETNCYKY